MADGRLPIADCPSVTVTFDNPSRSGQPTVMNWTSLTAFCLGLSLVLTLATACGGSQVRECQEPFSVAPADLGETPPESPHSPGDTPSGCPEDPQDGTE